MSRVRALPVAVALLVASGCKVSQFDTPPRGTEATEGSTLVVNVVPAVAADPVPVELSGAERPPWSPETQTCEVDSECRVMQPSDWSAEVECCYEYGCQLDYVAVNTATQQAQRAWQAANRYDCTEHLRSNGPCETRVPRCGLDQSAPQAVCRSGLCDIAWPDPWPVTDSDAQTCSIDADCRAYRPGSNSPLTRCCNAACDTNWTAINTATLDELTRWRTEEAVSCERLFGEANPCPEAVPCQPTAPAVTCAAGLCRVAAAN
jgi:hypothetical protein